MIIRGEEPSGNFTVVRNELINDSRLTWEARGVLIFLLSKPPNWEVQLGSLASMQRSCGQKQMSRILRELEMAGYLKRQPVHADGRIRWDSYVYGTPVPPQDGKRSIGTSTGWKQSDSNGGPNKERATNIDPDPDPPPVLKKEQESDLVDPARAPDPPKPRRSRAKPKAPEPEPAEEPSDRIVTPQVLADGWNELVGVEPGMTKVATLTASRVAKCKLRIKENPSFEFWQDVLNNVANSAFCKGLTKNRNGHENWKASFDWLISNDTIPVRVYEGRYA